MSGPGEYQADCTERITRVEDLPKALRVQRSRSYSRRPCPRCGRSCYRDRTFERTLHDLGDLVRERPSVAGHHDRRLEPLSPADFQGVWRRFAPTLRVPFFLSAPSGARKRAGAPTVAPEGAERKTKEQWRALIPQA
jgi:hypothetical protein